MLFDSLKHLIPYEDVEVAEALAMEDCIVRVDEPNQCLLGLQVLVNRVRPVNSFRQ